jgi:pimeloyl-ACP methyl ester carboxylesterase
MSAVKVGTLRVPGANLTYEVRGSGPILLLIHGAGGDARAFDGIATQLADRYTVVTYDRRGLSRSRLDDPAEEQRVETHAGDAHRLLALLGAEGADVIGSSGGAAVGLELVIRHPEQVRTLVAHVPPAPDGSDSGRHGEIRETHRREGAFAALQMILAQASPGFDDREPDVEPPAAGEGVRDRLANAEFLFTHELAMYDSYRPDIPALAAAATRTVIAAGRTGRELAGYRNAVRWADRLATSVVEFPGGHVGYLTHPRAFSARLREVLGAPEPPDASAGSHASVAVPE